jgi:mono/diheme cytochrome c family protein
VLVALSITTARADRDAKDIYLDKCAVCHGQDGMGKTAKGRKLKVVDVHETVKKFTVDEMIKAVQEGKGNDMDGYSKDFGKAEIKAVVEYYRGLAKQ